MFILFGQNGPKLNSSRVYCSRLYGMSSFPFSDSLDSGPLPFIQILLNILWLIVVVGNCLFVLCYHLICTLGQTLYAKLHLGYLLPVKRKTSKE